MTIFMQGLIQLEGTNEQVLHLMLLSRLTSKTEDQVLDLQSFNDDIWTAALAILLTVLDVVCRYVSVFM